jgi:hypothetical protein
MNMNTGMDTVMVVFVGNAMGMDIVIDADMDTAMGMDIGHIIAGCGRSHPRYE